MSMYDFRYRPNLWANGRNGRYVYNFRESYIWGIIGVIFGMVVGILCFIAFFNIRTEATVTKLYGQPLQGYYFEYIFNGKTYNMYNKGSYYYNLQVGDTIHVYVNPIFHRFYMNTDTKFVAVLALLISVGAGIPSLVFFIKKYKKERNQIISQRRAFLNDNKTYDGIMSPNDRKDFAKKNHWDDDDE